MPHLLLLRHAKSSWDDADVADIDRPLSARGRRAAAAVGKAIAADGVLPDRVLCSPSRRTRETLAGLLPYLPDDVVIAIMPALYEHDGDYRSVITEHGDAAERLMVIGHNPAIQATALLLTGSGETRLAHDVARKFPTAALAVIAFPSVGWSRLSPHSGRLETFVTPRDIEDGSDDSV